MANSIFCPNCNQPVSSQEPICQKCGINLAVAAALAESALSETIAKPTSFPLSPEVLVPRLGDYLVEKDLLTEEQLARALRIQQEHIAMDTYTMLGKILTNEGYITQDTLDTAITEQIYLLQQALRDSNNQLEERVEQRTLDLQAALEKLTQLGQLKTNFISNISHELRTPLAHMIGYIDLLRDRTLGPLTSDQEHALETLNSSYERLYNLIDELIQFSMLSQGEMSIKARKTDLDTLLENSIAHAQKFALEKEVKFTIRNEAQSLNILADPEKIGWVLNELAENAIKFNEVGGKVVLTAFQAEGLVVFRVMDNGPGIAPDQVSEIFEAFHQLDGSSTRRHGGTGIGLTLAKQIIESHQSRLMVKSQTGQGSVFQFSLPIIRKDQ